MSKRVKRGKGTRKQGYADRRKKDDQDEKRYDNAVEWYKRYPSLVEAASSIIFNQPYGRVAEVLDSSDTADYRENMTSIPGVIGYKFLPMYAESANDDSALNIANKNLYTYIRHANSGAANYESSDLTQYLITVCSLYTYVEQLKRDIRLVPTFNPLNTYVFGAALRIMGYTDANIATMRQTQAINTANLNQVIAQLNTFKIPKDLPILDRHIWLCSNIWKDDPLDKSSYYVFYTNCIAHYDWANRTIEMHDLGNLDLPARISAVQAEINNLLAYEDVGIMLGDILKAYKQEGCRVVSPMSLGEVCDAGYSQEALSQFTNAFVFGVGKFDYEIIQNSSNSQLLEMQSAGNPNGHLVVEMQSHSQTNGPTKNISLSPILVIDSDTPSSDEIIVATRFMIAGQFNRTGTKIKYDSVEFPTEIILMGSIAYYTTNTSGVKALSITHFQSLNYGAYDEQTPDSSDTYEYFRQLSVCTLLDKISYNPTIYYVWDDIDSNGDSEQRFDAKYLGKNWIPITSNWLNRLNKGCKQSLFSLPMFKLLESN